MAAKPATATTKRTAFRLIDSTDTQTEGKRLELRLRYRGRLQLPYKMVQIAQRPDALRS